MTDSIHKTHSSDMSASLPDRHRSNSYEYQPKRIRKGSISGRLRTASDLEELGYIDKTEKGLIKDLIISGDTKLQALLDKYEQGDGQDLLALIKEGYLAVRKPSIELIDGLDFDFINALRDDDDDDQQNDGGFFADLDADFSTLNNTNTNRKNSLDIHSINNNHLHHYSGQIPQVKKERRASTDDVADILQGNNRSRRATLDTLLLHDLIFDDEHLPDLLAAHHQQQQQLQNNSGNSHNNSNEDVFNDLYQQFSQDHHNSNNHRNNNNGNNNQQSYAHHTGSATSAIDLSAYAQHAAALQQQDKPSSNNNNKHSHNAKSNTNNSNNNNNSSTVNANNKGKKSLAIAPSTNNNASSLPNNNNTYTNNGNGAFLYNNNAGYSTGSSNGYVPGNNAYITSSAAYPNGLGSSTGQYLHNNPVNMHNSLNNNSINGQNNNNNNNMNGPNNVNNSNNNNAMRPAGYIGAYSPEQRRQRIEKFLEKRARRVWSRKVKYDVRKNFADSRLRIKGRFVKKEDEDIMRDLMTI